MTAKTELFEKEKKSAVKLLKFIQKFYTLLSICFIRTLTKSILMLDFCIMRVKFLLQNEQNIFMFLFNNVCMKIIIQP